MTFRIPSPHDPAKLDASGRPVSALGGLATWQGDTDRLTGDRILTAWVRPRVPTRR